MITKTIIMFSLVALSLHLRAQTDVVLARANYIFIQDTLHSTRSKPEDMILFLGKNATLFTSFNKLRHELAQDQKRAAQALQQAGNGNAPKLIKIDNTESEWMSKTDFIFFRKENKMIIKENFLYQAYLIEETIPNIHWKITKDTSNIEGISCKKAVANFEGRNWIAWFAPDLPFQNGPWKLNGLPGLIISAWDEKKEIEFQFAGFEKANPGEFVRLNDVRKRPSYQSGDISTVDVIMGTDVASAYFDNIIVVPKFRAVKTTKIELEKLKQAYQKDPKGFTRAPYGN
jgi:GLPGLI family protein